MTPQRLLDAAPATSLAVEHVCDQSVDLHDPLPIPTPAGLRLTYLTKGGTITGRITGEILPGGGDWVVVGADGVSRLDIRQTIRTEDGALIHYSAVGVARLGDGDRDRLARGERIPFRETYLRTAPRFETSDERYGWLTGRAFLSVSDFTPGHVDNRIYLVL